MRIYVRKTERASAPKDVYELAAAQVLEGKSCRSAAKEFGLCHVSLMRFIRKQTKFSASGDASDAPRIGYVGPRTVLERGVETGLAEYALNVSRLYYGMTPRDLRQLAFQFCVANTIEVPDIWKENESAGCDWLSGFLRRNPNLSIRTPEATSLARATAFNRHSVAQFFSNLRTVMRRCEFPPEAIYNMDETGVTTVQRPTKIVAEKGVKQIGKMTSGERGELVTVACAVNAIGNAIPPMMIFPRVRYNDRFIFGAPAGTIGAATKSGWMTEESFLVFLAHFRRHAKPAADNPVLLVLDNHASHLSVQALDFAKQCHVTILTFPPHCSHKLQPLDRTVYGPFKRYYNNAADSWMLNHAGVNMVIYDLAQLVGSAFKSAMTPGNIVAGFRVSGIYPFNADIFGDEEYLPSNVTDRDYPVEAVAGPAPPLVAGPAPPLVAGPPPPAVAGPAPPVVAGPAPPVVAGPAPPVVAGPAPPVVAGPAPPAVAGPAPPVVAGPPPPVVAGPPPPVVAGPAPPVVAGPAPPVVAGPAPPVVAGPAPPVVAGPAPPVVAGPPPPVVAGPPPPVVAGPATPVVAGHPEPVVAGPAPPVVAGPPPPVVAGPAPPVVAGPAPPVVAGPAPPVDAGPAPPVVAGPPEPVVAGPAPPVVAGPAPPVVAGPPPPVVAGPPPPVVAGPAPPVVAGSPEPVVAGPLSSTLISPEQLRPYPKAPPRKPDGRGRRRGKTMIATDTPEKDLLEAIQSSKKRPKTNSKSKRKLTMKGGAQSAKKGKGVEKSKGPNRGPNTKVCEWFCLVCSENFENSLPNEAWVQCQLFLKWSHVLCTAGHDSYLCHRCEPDSE